MEADSSHYWPTRRLAAIELSALTGERLTGATLKSWASDPTCPLPSGGGPIEKAALLEWCRSARRRPGRQRRSGAPPPDADDEGESAVRWRLEIAKLREEIKRLINLNNRTESRRLDADDVHAQITEACESFKSWLLRDLPGKTFDLCQGQERLISIELVRAQVIEQVNAWVIQNEPSYGGINAT
jgi:hypothetical protein